jgi:hypothetical protein
VSEPAPAVAGLLGHGGRDAGRELYVRHARKDGRSIAILRATDHGDSCVVEAEIVTEAGESVHPGPYMFEDTRQATTFMTEAVETLIYLGCDVQAQ